ncbi:CRISPR-associated helicase/endonuclease Cas3 [soil metagenome]
MIGRLDDRFEGLVERASGHAPYPYQRRIAEDGLPELLRVPTGAGKTLAATLPWLYRRRFHPDPNVRASTPHWLVFVLPMRVLVEQTRDAVARWLEAAGLAKSVGLHIVMGGEGRLGSEWRRSPERDAIFVGTLDMFISRALNRGYGASRFAWPIDFGLFNSGCQWVFDEVQLMGPALPTSRQLEGLRQKLGTASPCRSMWMSATVEDRWLSTVDLPETGSVLELSDADRTGGLRRRLDATKTIRRLILGDARTYARELAKHLISAHRPGTRTIAVLNTVERAREVWTELKKAERADGPALALLHSRFRPLDRAAREREALAEIDPSGPGRIVASTQVIEAGVDITAATLFTEAAPWPSIVQRAGRCNREGETLDASLRWSSPPRPDPYEAVDVQAAESELLSLEGSTVTAPGLGGRQVPVAEVVHPVLRRRDLVGLFDTTPDLAGNDLDVGRFIRANDDLDVQVAWRNVGAQGPTENEDPPTRDELCPVPVGQVRSAVKGGRAMWRFDHLERKWIACRAADIHPGQLLVARAADGGYSPAAGWDPKSRLPVTPVVAEEEDRLDSPIEAMDDDPLTTLPQRWVPLLEHLRDVEAEVRALVDPLHPIGLTPAMIEGAAVAGRLHDLGKVHPEFQKSLVKLAEPEELVGVQSGGPWAKSASNKRLRHERRYLRHELASALAILATEGLLAPIEELSLVAYLVAAHHGKVRLAIRSMPGEAEAGDGQRVALGIHNGDTLPAVEIPGGRIPNVTLDLSIMDIGDAENGGSSWVKRTVDLRDRPDLGPFRLAFLEALVRLADWRVSARG